MITEIEKQQMHARNINNMTQPLNEAYAHEVLEAYSKISDTFDEFTQLMRKRIPYEEWPERLQIAGISDALKSEYEQGSRKHIPEHDNALEQAIIRKIQSIGSAHTQLKSILESPLFEHLSKHDPYWNSDSEEIADKLYEIRCQINCLHDNLWDTISTLVGDE